MLLGASVLAALSTPTLGAKPNDRLAAYVQARAAEIEGEEGQSVRLFIDLAMGDPSDGLVARRAIINAIQSGQAGLAVPLAKRVKREELGFDGRLLLVVDALRQGRGSEALAMLQAAPTTTESKLLAPLVQAWVDTEAGSDRGVEALKSLPADSPLAGSAAFQRINMLLALKRVDEAVPLARTLMDGKDGMVRQQIALAAGFSRRGRTDVARELLKGDEAPLVAARAMLDRNGGLPAALAMDKASDGVAELLLSLAADLSRNSDRGLPLALARIAQYADPDNGAPAILSALFLDAEGRTADALAATRSVGPGNLLADDALDIEARILSNADRDEEALRRVEGPALAPNASADAIGRYADVLAELGRHAEAAVAYARAIDAAKASGATRNIWTLHLLRASSLEEAGRWAEAKIELQAAMAAQPDNPVILNFLGYGKLERGEDLDAAEAMIRKASAMRPDDASITDSLGWALYKRGRLTEAIDTLHRAAAGDPAQSEIHEHLGDALFKSGRRIEARFAWSAALLNAEQDARPRLEAKLDMGLSPSNAAP